MQYATDWLHFKKKQFWGAQPILIFKEGCSHRIEVVQLEMPHYDFLSPHDDDNKPAQTVNWLQNSYA
jgi:hypothetical protein